MVSAHRIIINGLSSDEFDIIGCLSFDGDNGTSSSFLNQDGVYTEHYSGRRIIHRLKYNEIFSPTITLIKKDYSDFDAEANRRILSWLTASDKPGWIEFYKDDSNVIEYQIFGGVESVELYKLGNSRIVGYVVTFTSTHPYAFSRKMEITKQISKPTSFTVVSNSDEYNKPLYPKVTVTFGEDIYIPVRNMTEAKLLDTSYKMMPNTIYALYLDDEATAPSAYYINIPSIPYKGRVIIGLIDAGSAEVDTYYCVDGRNIVKRAVAEDGKTDIWETVVEASAAVQIENIYIKNGVSTTKTSIVSGGVPKETIMLDGENKIIAAVTDIIGAETRIIGDDFNFEWPLLMPGDNNIIITGNCNVTFEWHEPRKVGDL